jgi:small subunit ribosomal protein S1
MGGSVEQVDHPMSFLLDDDYDFDFPQTGDIREGQVVAHRNSEILIDIGSKSEGFISGHELDIMDDETREKLAVGNWVSVYIVSPEDKNGNIILSYAKAVEEEDWNRATELLDSQEVYSSEIIGSNRGGVLVKLGYVRGFIPASQLSVEHRSNSKGDTNEEKLRSLIGQEATAKVIEVDRSRNRLILSERAAMKEIRAAQRASLMDELEEGDVREGFVVNIADFGAFVDIGGVQGLVHLSELSWKRISNPGEVVSVGETIEVMVINVDEERGRVALSLKRMEPDPWTIVNDTYEEGELVEVTITKITSYGAFARLNDDYALEGLIHVSEMASDHIEHPHDIVERDQIVAARIIRIDSEQRQLGLSIKQVASEEFIEADLASVSNAEAE